MHVDHKNEVIIWISFPSEDISRWSKIYFFRKCIKEDVVVTFLILGFILTIFLALSRISFSELYLFFVEVCHLSCTISAELKFTHFANTFRYDSTPVLGSGICNTVFYSVDSLKPVCFSKVLWIDIRSRK